MPIDNLNNMNNLNNLNNDYGLWTMDEGRGTKDKGLRTNHCKWAYILFNIILIIRQIN